MDSRPDAPGRPLRVLALTGHPVEAAGARYRIIQFWPALRAHGVAVEHHSFLSSAEWARLYAPDAWVFAAGRSHLQETLNTLPSNTVY